jgi:hypothetical protein
VNRITGKHRLLEDRNEEKGEIAVETYDEPGLYCGSPHDDESLMGDAREKILDALQVLFPE